MTQHKLKIVFFGTPEFAVESLRAIHESDAAEVVAVVTTPDKPAGRGKHLMQSAVKQYALSIGLPVLQPVALKDPEFVGALSSFGADLFVVIAFRILPEVVWGMPPMGTFNLHASLLPRYRGAAPINWAVINGDDRTGVTTFFLKQQMDTGDVIDRRSIEITDADNAGTVHDRLMVLGAELTLDTIRRIAAGEAVATPQELLPEGETPTPAPKIFKDTCHIDWSMPALSVHNLVRGLSPYPAAWSALEADGADAGTLKIFTTVVTDRKAFVPGRVSVEGSRMYADCGDSAIEILSLQAQGKRRMDTADFLRGCRYNEMILK